MDITLNQEADVNEYTLAETQDSAEKTRPRKKQPNKVYCAAVSNKGKDFIDVDFKGFGIRIKTDKLPPGRTVNIEYKSEIGKSDFEYRLV